jgi:Ca2+-binding EF-hand superfamily protein
LAKQKGFEPYAAFKRIDRMGNDRISAADINIFLRENMVDYLNEAECFHMFNFFDSEGVGYLTFTE